MVGVVCALAAEARHLGSGKRRLDGITLLADGTLLSVSGMGCAAAARAAEALVREGAAGLVSWGMAGGLDPRLAAGTIFLPSEIIAPGGAAVATTPAWRAGLAGALVTHRPIVTGRLLTSSRSVGSPGDKAALFHDTSALAVDMESLAVAEVARNHALPFIAVRVIVDSAADALPQAVTAAADSEGHLQVWRLMGALARAPGDLPPLIRLAFRYRTANRSLAAVARVGSLSRAAFAVGTERVQ